MNFTCDFKQDEATEQETIYLLTIKFGGLPNPSKGDVKWQPLVIKSCWTSFCRRYVKNNVHKNNLPTI